MTGASGAPKSSTVAREAYFLEFAEKVRVSVSTPLMVTGGFRSYEGMNAALRSGRFGPGGLGRLLALEPDAPQLCSRARMESTGFAPSPPASNSWIAWR